MKVTSVKENKLKFNNGLVVTSWHDQDCCEHNYLDFGQFQVGDEFNDCKSVRDFLNMIVIKKDGFSLKDKTGLPKWIQARSYQNGYYSNILGLHIIMDKEEYKSTECLSGRKDIY